MFNSPIILPVILRIFCDFLLLSQLDYGSSFEPWCKSSAITAFSIIRQKSINCFDIFFAVIYQLLNFLPNHCLGNSILIILIIFWQIHRDTLNYIIGIPLSHYIFCTCKHFEVPSHCCRRLSCNRFGFFRSNFPMFFHKINNCPYFIIIFLC